MRRIGNLFGSVVEYDNLLAAWIEVKRGKRMHSNVLHVESRLPVVLSKLQDELVSGAYHPEPCRTFVLHDPKIRTIEAPHLRDRIVQHALTRIIRPAIESRLIRQTYACIQGRGTHAASNQAHRYLRQVPAGFVLNMDIRKFFPSIHRDTLMEQVRKILKCERTVSLLELFVRTDDSPIGIPIGATTSQILANLALNPLDHAAKRVLGMTRYVRYMDDALMVHADKGRLWEVFSALEAVVESLQLRVNPKSGIARVRDGVDFVGYRHFHGMKLIRKRSLYNIRRTLSRQASLPRVMAFLSHAKGTASLPFVASAIERIAPEFSPQINQWRAAHGA